MRWILELGARLGGLVLVIGLVSVAGLGLGACYEDQTRCSERPERGPCDLDVQAYWFDGREGECKEFIWGGCDGNVPFESIGECRETCEVPRQASGR